LWFCCGRLSSADWADFDKLHRLSSADWADFDKLHRLSSADWADFDKLHRLCGPPSRRQLPGIVPDVC
jgi:hypothetical protein